MALQNDTDNSYLRVVLTDTPVDLKNKVFVMELHKDSSTRDNPSKFDKAIYDKVDVAENWSLDLTGDKTLDEIASEAYRCIKLEPAFASGWSDV